MLGENTPRQEEKLDKGLAYFEKEKGVESGSKI